MDVTKTEIKTLYSNLIDIIAWYVEDTIDNDDDQLTNTILPILIDANNLLEDENSEYHIYDVNNKDDVTKCLNRGISMMNLSEICLGQSEDSPYFRINVDNEIIGLSYEFIRIIIKDKMTDILQNLYLKYTNTQTFQLIHGTFVLPLF